MPDYFRLGRGVVSITAHCPGCNSKVKISKKQPNPITVDNG